MSRVTIEITPHMVEETAKVLFKLGLADNPSEMAAAEHILRFGLDQSEHVQPDGNVNKLFGPGTRAA